MSQSVTHPKHYNKGKIEVIEFIEDQGLNYHCGQVIKYICRAGVKSTGNIVEDLSKARWYLERQIELIQAKYDDRSPVRPNDMNPRTK